MIKKNVKKSLKKTEKFLKKQKQKIKKKDQKNMITIFLKKKTENHRFMIFNEICMMFCMFLFCVFI